MKMAARIGALLCALLQASVGAAESDLSRTWAAARVYLPAASAAGYRQMPITDLPAALTWSSPRAAVVYAHGCDGISEITHATARFLAQAGLLVVAPDGFARADKPQSCDPAIPRGGLHRAVLGRRQQEIRLAADRLRVLAPDLPLILMGQSEGAIAVATLPPIGAQARVIEGWTCHAGWPEYRGLAAPAPQPVLSLLGEDDPWFRVPPLRGDCGAYMTGPAQRSIVYRRPSALARRHWLTASDSVRAEVLTFLHPFLRSQD